MMLLLSVVLLATGCASKGSTKKTSPTARPGRSATDVSGHWSGTWTGFGIVDVAREEGAVAELSQEGRRGGGFIILEGTIAAESIPVAIRRAGSMGIPVVFEMSGSRLVMRHELGSEHFIADFTVSGDRMTGKIRGTELPAIITLVRAPMPTAPAPAPPAPTQTSAEPLPPTARPVAAMTPEPPKPEATQPAPPESPKPEEAAPAPEQPRVVAEATAPVPLDPEMSKPSLSDYAERAELKTVFFDFDKAVVGSVAAKRLDANAEWLKANPEIVILIEGHCDERGTNEYNIALGDRRARAARDYLVAHGVAAARITIMSYGEERAACSEHNEECWTQNRRAEFLATIR